MKAETPRNLALRVLNGLSPRPDPALTPLDDVFRNGSHLDERDRAFTSHLVQGVLRWRARLDWIIQQAAHFPITKIRPPILNILRLALYQIFFLDRVPYSAAVNEAVKQSKEHGATHVVSFVNGILRNICRDKDSIAFPDPESNRVEYLSVYYSYPEWLVRKWIREWGPEATEHLLAAGNRIPPLTIRTNLLKLRRTQLIERLSEMGLSARPTPFSPEGIWLEGFRGRVDRLAPFQEGLFQVQDEAAQITAHLLKPQPGERILDICAGRGGKTTHLAALAGDRAWVLALDISSSRLLSLGSNSGRLGIRSINAVAADAAKPLSHLLHSQFDKILVDAPCSGLGVISRHPDGKWNRNEGDVARLAQLQKTLIHAAVCVLRRGGRLLYVTCTISEEENEGVVQGCLEGNRDIVLENMKDDVPGWGLDLIDRRGFFRTLPHVHHTDGFFAALFTKR